jgi:uncharacterized short protein YbdD (DUF466 family)
MMEKFTMRAQKNEAGLGKRCWLWLRQASGDFAYENYLRHLARSAQGQRPLSRAEFYQESLGRRYSSVSRCC